MHLWPEHRAEVLMHCRPHSRATEASLEAASDYARIDTGFRVQAYKGCCSRLSSHPRARCGAFCMGVVNLAWRPKHESIQSSSQGCIQSSSQHECIQSSPQGGQALCRGAACAVFGVVHLGMCCRKEAHGDAQVWGCPSRDVLQEGGAWRRTSMRAWVRTPQHPRTM